MEKPLTIYGRLLEAFHLSGYAFERAYSELEYMLEGGHWIECGFDTKNDFVRSIDLSKFKHSVEQRKRFASLMADADVSQRATAAMLGVSHTTVERDLGTNVPVEDEDASKREVHDEENGTNVPDEWWQSDADPAKLAKRQSSNDQRDIRREAKLAEIIAGNAGLGTAIRYPIIYADPPWRYENPPIGASGRSIENHYPTMTLDEICALPVAELATDDAILYLWATAPKLVECLAVVAAWGFVYRTCLVWDKQIIGMGYHARSQHEILLIGRRGEFPPPLAGTQPSSIHSERRGEHSAKPIFYYDMIERCYPGVPKIELFARAPRDGWAAWGNQAETHAA